MIILTFFITEEGRGRKTMSDLKRKFKIFDTTHNDKNFNKTLIFAFLPSYHEMGIFDLPASLTYVRNLKNDAVIYVGHSMGSTVFYVMASEYPEIAAWTCKIAFSLAPAVFFNNMKTLSVILAAPFHQMLRVSGKKHFLDFFNTFTT